MQTREIVEFPIEIWSKIVESTKNDQLLNLRLLSQDINTIATHELLNRQEKTSLNFIKKYFEQASIWKPTFSFSRDFMIKLLRRADLDTTDRMNGLTIISDQHDIKINVTEAELNHIIAHIKHKSIPMHGKATSLIRLLARHLTEDQRDQVISWVFAAALAEKSISEAQAAMLVSLVRFLTPSQLLRVSINLYVLSNQLSGHYYPDQLLHLVALLPSEEKFMRDKIAAALLADFEKYQQMLEAVINTINSVPKLQNLYLPLLKPAQKQMLVVNRKDSPLQLEFHLSRLTGNYQDMLASLTHLLQYYDQLTESQCNILIECMLKNLQHGHDHVVRTSLSQIASHLSLLNSFQRATLHDALFLLIYKINHESSNISPCEFIHTIRNYIDYLEDNYRDWLIKSVINITENSKSIDNSDTHFLIETLLRLQGYIKNTLGIDRLKIIAQRMQMINGHLQLRISLCIWSMIIPELSTDECEKLFSTINNKLPDAPHDMQPKLLEMATKLIPLVSTATTHQFTELLIELIKKQISHNLHKLNSYYEDRFLEKVSLFPIIWPCVDSKHQHLIVNILYHIIYNDCAIDKIPFKNAFVKIAQHFSADQLNNLLSLMVINIQCTHVFRDNKSINSAELLGYLVVHNIYSIDTLQAHRLNTDIYKMEMYYMGKLISALNDRANTMGKDKAGNSFRLFNAPTLNQQAPSTDDNKSRKRAFRHSN